MHLLNAYCCHFYGSQAWSSNDKNIKNIIAAWNRAAKKIWNLPYDPHRMVTCALNNGSNALDFIYRRFCKLYNCVANSENTKLSMFIKMCKNYERMILSRNLRCVCKNWCVSELQLEIRKKCLFSKGNIEECEHVTDIIGELSRGINGFSLTEITDILAYISTN